MGWAARLQDLFSGFSLRRVDWDELYRSGRPEDFYYDVAGLDPDVDAALARRGPPPGARVLDIGTGRGSAALALARRGYSVTAVDVSARALELARERAAAEKAAIDFVQADIAAGTAGLKGPFAGAFDRGCFHGLLPGQRPGYVEAAARLLGAGGKLYLKTMSREESLKPGPYRFTADEIATLFAGAFAVEESAVAPLPVRTGRAPLYLLSVLRRL